MQSMQKLSSVDRAFFLLETDERPMNVGTLIVLAPPRRGTAGFADALVRRMLRCPVGPPFNYRLDATGFAGLQELVEVPDVDPARQVFRHRLPPGNDLQLLLDRVCRLHVKRLDRRLPLWQMHVFDGLPRGRVALYFKTHHGLIDGIGFISIVVGAVSRRPNSRTPQAIWRGRANVSDGPAATPPPSRRAPPLELLDNTLRAGRTASDMVRLLWHGGLRSVGLGDGLALPFVTTPDVLKAEPSVQRVIGHCALPLARVKAVARAGDAKVNDVLLAALDVALNRYLEEHGTVPTKPLVADMPVALRDGGSGNRITILQVPLGRPGSAPAERLAEIVRETRQVKQEVRTLAADTLFLYSILEHTVASAIESLDLGHLPMLANLVVSNPAGLDAAVYFNGAAVELALPVSVVAHHQALNVTITNYAQQLHVTFMALREAMPDVQQLADATVTALTDLDHALVQRTPGTRARRTRPASRKARARATQH
jgi:WS/DGAT/MGAT family acyltransferase